MSVADQSTTAAAEPIPGSATARAPRRFARTGRPDAPGRFDALDGLRGLAALGVLVLHVWMFNYGDAGRPPKGALDLAIGELRLGVELFFVLSGFLLYRPFVGAALDGAPRPSLGRYALRRAARILPAYWAAIAASFLLLRHIGHPMQVDIGQLPIFLLFAENHFDDTIKHLDPPMWTLAIEVSFYAALPLLALLAPRLGGGRWRQLAVPVGLAVAGLACTAAAALNRWPVTLSTSLLLHLVEFGAGMAIATLLHRRRLALPVALGLALGGVALIVANSWWHACTIGPQQTRNVIGDAPGITGLALVVAAVVGSAWRGGVLARGPIRWLGTVSYGVYLAHFPVIVGLRGTGHWPQTLERELPLVAGLSLAFATASWLLLERPAIQWARRVTAARRPAGQTTARQPTGELRVLRPQPAER